MVDEVEVEVENQWTKFSLRLLASSLLDQARLNSRASYLGSQSTLFGLEKGKNPSRRRERPPFLIDLFFFFFFDFFFFFF